MGFAGWEIAACHLPVERRRKLMAEFFVARNNADFPWNRRQEEGFT